MKYRKKPVVIDAVRWTGQNCEEISQFMHSKNTVSPNVSIIIPTLEGNHEARIGDWIIKGIRGEFYPCKPDIFEQTYELEEANNDR